MRAATRPKRKTLVPPAPLPAGTRLGRWQMRNLLGSGAYGIVYRASDDNDDDEVALKEYLPRAIAVRTASGQVVARTPEAAAPFAAGLERFLADARKFAELDHPSIVKVHEVWEQNGTAYMAMDFVTGRSLAVAQQARGRPPREAALRALLEPLLDALEALHAAGLEHGDVSPPSILIDAMGRPILLEMISVRAALGTAAESTGPRDGYAPPELYAATEVGDSAAPSARGPWSDIYALGAVLHFLLAGKPPPPAPQRTAADRVAPRLRAIVPSYSPEFLAAIDWMLAPKPAERPQDIAAVRRAFASGELPAAYAPPRRSKLGPMLRRHWVPLTVTLGVLLVLATAAGVVYYLVNRGYMHWPPRLP